MPWKPTATASSSYIDDIIAELRGGDRDRALAHLDTVQDTGLLYVVACSLTDHRSKVDSPSLRLDADGYRAFIRAAI